MAGIDGINHITFAVENLDRSLDFYCDLLGGGLRARWDRGAYVELGTLWLCLSEGPVETGSDYSHVALSTSAEDFPALAERIAARAGIWQENTSEGPSLYFLDPDGHRLELHVGTLASRLADYRGRGDGRVRTY